MRFDAIKTVIAAVVIMLCLGSIYAWSIYVPFLVADFGYSVGQTQVIFGFFIGLFTLTMILTRSLLLKYGGRKMGIAAAVVYAIGYIVTYFSGGNFFIVFLGIAVLSGLATGVGYSISITIPVEWFPNRKGLITGLVAGGFGGGAILESLISQQLFKLNLDILQVFLIVGLSKGVLLMLASFYIKRPESQRVSVDLIPISKLVKDPVFVRLFIGIFTGTFAGLLIIGNLKPIGLQFPISVDTLVIGITVFSVANFSGRLFWGWLNDFVSGRILIPLSLFLIGVFTIIIGYVPLNGPLYLILSFVIGFSFGANFVVYANETAQHYGLANLGKIYPFIFFGYGISGVVGPSVGGMLRDAFGNYQYPALVAFILCMVVFVAMLVLQKQKMR